MLKIIGDASLPQLLLIHGGGVGSWMWDDAVKHLEPHYQLILAAMPYHHSEMMNTSTSFTIESYAATLIEQLHLIRNEQPIGVVGFSLGAQVSLQLLTISPSFFSFAMINSALCTKVKIPFSLLKFITTLTMPLAKLPSFARLQARTLYIPNHLFDAYFTLSSSMTTQQLTEILHTNMNFELTSTIQQSKTRIYITYGEKENRAIKKSATVLHDNIPSSITYIVKGIGHGFPLAEPKKFAQFILTHFKV